MDDNQQSMLFENSVRDTKRLESNLDEILKFLTEDTHELRKKVEDRKEERYAPEPPFMNVLDTFFHSNLNDFHVKSFEFMLSQHIPQIIGTYGVLNTLLENIRYTLNFSNVKIVPSDPPASFCHIYGLHYTCDIFVDATLSSTKHMPITKNMLLARLSLMTGVDSSSDYDLVGGFIVRGKIRTCPAVKTGLTDFPIFVSKKDCTVVQIRATHHDKIYRATSTLELNIRLNVKQSKALGFIGCRLPFAKRDIHVVVLAICLGASPQSFFQLVKFIASQHYQEEKFKSYEISIYHNKHSDKIQTQTDALILLAKLYNDSKNSLATGILQLQNEVLPHLKHSNPMYEAQMKLFALASLTAQLILVHEKIIPMPSRDDWSLSQIVTPANHVGALFRLLFINNVRQTGKTLRRALMKHATCESDTLNDIDLANVFCERRLSQRLASAIATGIWSPRRNGVTMSLNTSNDDAIQLQLRRIASALKQTDGAHEEARGITKDQYGFIDPAYSPDGEGTGLVYELSMFATITPPRPNYVAEAVTLLLTHHSQDNMELISNFMTNPFELTSKNRFFMDINGAISHMIKDCDQFIQLFLKLRRELVFDKFTFIADYPPYIVLQSREGLIARPLIVANRVKDITSEHSFEECISQGIIEYVCPQEQCTLTRIAMTANDITPQTTHVEIFQAGFLGLLAGSVVFATNQQAARLTLICGQLKQVITAAVGKERGAQNGAHLYYAFRNLVTTTCARLRPGSDIGRGTPAVVAVLPLKRAQEDGVVVKKSFGERGGMMCGTTLTYVSEASTPKNSSALTERFEKPEMVLSKKVNSYSAITKDGIPREKTHISERMVAIAKTQTIIRTPGANIGTSKQLLTRRDISTTVRLGHGGQVIMSLQCFLPSGIKCVVRIETVRHFELADKLTTLAAMKGVAADIMPDENMPWSETTGLIPDVVFQPLGILSRMTPSFDLAATTGKVVALTGDFRHGEDTQDYATSKEHHMKRMGDILLANGFNRHSTEIFRDGTTGEIMSGDVFVGVLDILRLNHLAESKVHFRSTGSVDPRTRMPKDGRKHGSGARNSEMEAIALCAHGASEITQQRYCDLSDKYYVYACKKCMLHVDDIGADINFSWCRNCLSEVNVRKVKLTFNSLSLLYYLNCLGISHFLEIDDVDEI